MKTYTLPPHLLQYARNMRHQPTDTEHVLWQFLRARRMGGFKFRRQHPFKHYILDFYCLEARLAIELDGGQHNESSQLEYDQKRTLLIEQHGIRLLRYWNNQVLQVLDDVLENIWLHLHTIPLTPTSLLEERAFLS